MKLEIHSNEGYLCDEDFKALCSVSAAYYYLHLPPPKKAAPLFISCSEHANWTSLRPTMCR